MTTASKNYPQMTLHTLTSHGRRESHERENAAGVSSARVHQTSRGCFKSTMMGNRGLHGALLGSFRGQQQIRAATSTSLNHLLPWRGSAKRLLAHLGKCVGYGIFLTTWNFVRLLVATAPAQLFVMILLRAIRSGGRKGLIFLDVTITQDVATNRS